MLKIYEDYDTDSTFNWYQQYDSVSNSYYMRGITSIDGLGDLWLYKSFKVNKKDSHVISVNGRTAKRHNGDTIGPSMYVFDGQIDYPSHQSGRLIDWTTCYWDDYNLSPWINLNVNLKAPSSQITVALKVHDAWDRWQVFNDFTNLIIVTY